MLRKQQAAGQDQLNRRHTQFLTHDPADLPTVLAPRLVELCFQTAGLWEAGRTGRLGLPAHVERVLVVGSPPPDGATGRVYAVARPVPAGDGEAFDCTVLDGDGRVILRVEGYRTVALPGAIPPDVRGPLQTVMSEADDGP